MKDCVDKYIEAEEELTRVSNDGSSSFMDVSIRIDRVKEARNKAIQYLGEQTLECMLINRREQE